jgi:hypothetical protein
MKMEEAFDLATEVADFATMLPMWEAWPVNRTEIVWLCYGYVWLLTITELQ